ncbi:MAG: sulfate permease [Gammaproteobacteria bacterium]|nr:sulfate permease [Gammaproteobacteria bacterium]
MNPILRLLPARDWLANYQRGDLPGDVVAGLVVAIMLVPQGMAYALLAGLPAQVGLYASVLPLLAYALFGSSRTLAVGPVAIISLMVAAAAGEIAAPGSAAYLSAALLLALLSGLMLLVMGLARLGFIVNFMSHPVISGFTSAAALVIGFSQLKHLLGISLPQTHQFLDVIVAVFGQLASINPVTLVIGLGSIGLLLSAGRLARFVADPGSQAGQVLGRSGPLFAVVLFTGLVAAFGLDRSHAVAIIGEIPAGLPEFAWPGLDRGMVVQLLTSAALIALVGFLESVSVAKALASKRREIVDADRELVGLGAANIAAALTGGYPVTGGFSRSVVNFTAGANTQLAAMVTAVLVAIALLALTPLFFFLPKAVLAGIIVVAVARLVDVAPLRNAWRYNKADAAALLVTFLAVLSWGVEVGILTGIGSSLLLLLWRASRPHVAIVGRVGDSEHFRNVKRHQVRTCPQVAAVRIDESLHFANARVLEETLLGLAANSKELEHIVLICSAVNLIDSSGLETLYKLREELQDAGITLHLAEVKGPVEDRLQRTDFLEVLKPGRVFLSTDEAMRALDCV